MISPKEASSEAKSAVYDALKIDDKLAEAHTSLAWLNLYYDWDWASAESEFEKAIALNPGYALAHKWYNDLLLVLGRNDEAKRRQEIYKGLNPADNPLEPGRGRSHFSNGYLNLGRGKYREAIAAFEKAVKQGYHPLAETGLAFAYALSGETDKARQKLNAMLDMRKERYVSSWSIASIYGVLGKIDEEFEWLDKAVDERYPIVLYITFKPEYEKIRSDKRYNALLKKMGLPKD